MKLIVHDVGHGSCVSLMHENGNTMLWDCGHTEESKPSLTLPELGVSKIDYFFVTNYDEDHISDLPSLRKKVHPRSMFRNMSISQAQLRSLKLQSGPISIAMESMLDMIGEYVHGPLAPAPEFPRVNFSTFYNSYGDDYLDTNNISLVTFLQCGNSKFIIPGDIERKGWLGLLQKEAFVKELASVNNFIASHHGRESGYCEEIFNHCNPDVFVFSDSNIKHATQEMSQIYAQHAKGIKFNGATRYVLTTRNDGSLTWNI